MKKLRNIFLALFALIAPLLITGCKQFEQLKILHPKGMIAQNEKDLLIIAVLLMLIIVLPVLIAIVLIAYRYRASNKNAKYDPHFTHSRNLELVWWGFPIIIVAILATITWKTSHSLDPYRPINNGVKPITIEAVSLNWRWLFIYPEKNIATVNFVEFPVNTPIQFYVSSDSPMNSLMIDQLAGQIYAMDGMRTQIHILANQTGDYQGQSISFSGNGFSNMKFIATVVNAEDFNQWVAKAQLSPNILTWSTYQNLVPDSQDTAVYYFKLGDQNLFDEIIEKYTGPDMAMAMGPTMDKIKGNIQGNIQGNIKGNVKDNVSKTSSPANSGLCPKK